MTIEIKLSRQNTYKQNLMENPHVIYATVPILFYGIIESEYRQKGYLILSFIWSIPLLLKMVKTGNMFRVVYVWDSI